MFRIVVCFGLVGLAATGALAQDPRLPPTLYELRSFDAETMTLLCIVNHPIPITKPVPEEVTEIVDAGGSKVPVQRTATRHKTVIEYVTEVSKMKVGEFTTVDGKSIPVQEAAEKLKNQQTILYSADPKGVDPKFRSLLNKDAIVAIIPKTAAAPPEAPPGGSAPVPLVPLQQNNHENKGPAALPSDAATPPTIYGFKAYNAEKKILTCTNTVLVATQKKVLVDVTDYVDKDGQKVPVVKKVEKLQPFVERIAIDVIYTNVDQFQNADGKALTVEEAVEKLNGQKVILFTGDPNGVAEKYRKIFAKDVIIAIKPEALNTSPKAQTGNPLPVPKPNPQ